MKHLSIRGFVKIEPFIYNTIFILLYICCLTPINDMVYQLFNLFIYYSWLQAIFGIIRSYKASQCGWHRFAVITPLIIQIPAFTQEYVIDLGRNSLQMMIITVIIMVILTIYSGYKVFRDNERRKEFTRDRLR